MVSVDLFKRGVASVALIAAALGLGGCEAGSEPLVWKAQQFAFVVDRGRGALQVLSVRSGVSLLKTIHLGQHDIKYNQREIIFFKRVKTKAWLFSMSNNMPIFF